MRVSRLAFLLRERRPLLYAWLVLEIAELGSLVSKRLSFRDCQRCAARVPIRCDDDALLSWHLKTLEEPKQATVPARLSQKLRRAEAFWGAVHLRQQLQRAAPPSLRLLLRRHIRIATVSSLFLREERKTPGPRWCKSPACILESYMESLAVVKGQRRISQQSYVCFLFGRADDGARGRLRSLERGFSCCWHPVRDAGPSPQ